MADKPDPPAPPAPEQPDRRGQCETGDDGVETKADRSFWRWMGNNHEQVKILFSDVTVLAIFIGYYFSVAGDKSKAAFDLVKEYSKGESLQARERHFIFWLKEDNLAAFKAAEAGGRVNEFFLETVRSNGFEKDIFILNDSYKKAISCTTAGVCDKKVVCHAFGKDMRTVLDYYFSFYEVWQQEWGDESYSEIAAFVESCATDGVDTEP